MYTFIPYIIINLRHLNFIDMLISILLKIINFRLGEGCTHIAGLLFSLENISTTDKNEEPCTSKPCEWSKPRKRKRKADMVKNIQFKKLKYGKEPSEKLRCEFPPSCTK